MYRSAHHGGGLLAWQSKLHLSVDRCRVLRIDDFKPQDGIGCTKAKIPMGQRYARLHFEQFDALVSRSFRAWPNYESIAFRAQERQWLRRSCMGPFPWSEQEWGIGPLG